MNKNTAKIFLVLTILSLGAIGLVFASGMLKNKPKEESLTKKASDVLGEAVERLFTSTTNSNLDTVVQNTIQNTKEVVSQRVIEAEKTILKEVEKEISNLTQSQIEALKLQICRDWGIITIVPTKKP